MTTEVDLEVMADTVTAQPRSRNIVTAVVKGVALCELVAALQEQVGAGELVKEWGAGDLLDAIGQDEAVAHFGLELAE